MSLNPFTWWDRFWFAPTSAAPVAAFRVLLGGFLVSYFLTKALDVTLLFSNEGVYLPWLLPDYGPPPVVAWMIYLLTLASMTAFTLGYRTNLSTPLTLTLFLYHYFLQLAVKHSTFERLIIEWLVLFCFVESGRPTVAAWMGRLIRFQCVMLYVGAGLWKAANPHWRSGVLLHATLQGMWSTDLGFWLVRHVHHDQTWATLSQVVIIGEILVGVFFCFRRLYPIAIISGIAFHLGNVFFLSIPEFLVCITPYVFFIEPATLQRWGEWIASHLRCRQRR